MEILKIILTSLGSITALFILTKIMGNREMSQLSMFDYINGITIGSIAAEMATALEDDYIKPLTAMIVYALVVLILAIGTNKSIKLRRFIEGKPVILYFNGTIYRKNLSKANMDVNEFLTQCRVSGYFDLSQIYTVILESSGKLSFLPKEVERPTTPKDLKLTPNQSSLCANVIIDGHIMYQNLKHTGNNEKWLTNQLNAHGVSDVSSVMLATCDADNKVHVYKEVNDDMKYDVLI